MDEVYRVIALTLAMVISFDEIGQVATTVLRRERLPERQLSRPGRVNGASRWRF